jgi:hypothetical protein
MAYTEAEANEKWCPMARGPYHFASGKFKFTGNRSGDANDEEFPRCITSECMAWRWVMSRQFREEFSNRPDANKGYCGAFGDG